MICEFLGLKGTWTDVLNSARTTVNKEEVEKEPSSKWKKSILLAEHSPIRQLIVKAKWYDMKYWVSVHIVRHWLGIIHFVRSQRNDRTGVPRDDKPQSELIEHEIEVNAQAMINISRKRLCGKAHPETRAAWLKFLNSVKPCHPELVSVCVPECIYRGFCPEMESCGLVENPVYNATLARYRDRNFVEKVIDNDSQI